MDVSSGPVFDTIAVVDEFTLEMAADRATRFDTLLHRGRPVADVQARILEAQFRLSDGSTLVMLNDDTPFKEVLTLVLVGPGLQVRDEILVGGAFTPGYLTAAYPCSPDEIAFCWHDRDQVVTIRRTARWFGLRSSWLKVRDVAIKPPRPVAVDAVTLSSMIPRFRRPPSRPGRRRRGRPLPAMVWLAWLSLRTAQLRRDRGHGRGPRR